MKPVVDGARRVRNRFAQDAAVRWLSIAVTLLLILLFVAANLAAVNSARATEFARNVVQEKTVSEGLQSEIDRYKPAYTASLQTKARESALAGREDAVGKRESDAEATASSLQSREDAVKKREDAAAANTDDGSWWVSQVRECLGRSGSYRAATVTEGSLGRDTTCYTG